jgi:16S rRNA (cytosine967-C5)-methyltransferase
MTPAARLAATIKIMDGILHAQKPSDQIMHTYLQQRRYIGSKDRKAIATLVYTLLRHYGRLSWWCLKQEVPPTGRIYLLLWMALGEQSSVDEIYDAFSGLDYAPDRLNQTEQNLLKKVHGKKLHAKDMPDGIRHECPPIHQHALQNLWGADFATEMQALDSEAPLDIRVNTLKATRDEVFVRLQQDGFDVSLTPLSPIGIRVQGRPPFSVHPLYKQGWFEIQDEGSQLLSLLSGVKQGEWGTDLCAGAGGKTLALAALLKNKGRLWACDIEARRLENSKLRIRRAGVDCVELQPLKDMRDPWLKRHQGKCDFVLVDAPCSGTGTWRRSPFSRWQQLGPSLQDVIEMQHTAIEAAAPLLKKGGRLIYATCSLLPQENHKQVEKFLETHDDFKPVPLADMWARVTDLPVPDALDLSKHLLALTPAKHNTDGFFVSVIEKQ